MYTAFAKLGMVRWTEEQVDEYVAEVWRQAMEFSFTRESLEKVTQLIIANGFADDVSVQLPGSQKVAMCKYTVQAWGLIQNTGWMTAVEACDVIQ